MAEEKPVWSGTASQLTNFWAFALCVLIVTIPYGIYRYLKVKTNRFELTTERLRITTGILSRQTDELELYRVKDITLIEPFFLRLFSLGNLVMHTSDKTTPQLVIPAIAQPRWLLDELRKYVEVQRQAKRVREVDYE